MNLNEAKYEGDFMKNQEIRLFIIEDSIFQRKKTAQFLTNFFMKEYSINLVNIDISDINSFYKEIDQFNFYPTDLFIIDYDLLTYYTGIDIALLIKKKNPKAIIGFLTSYKDKAVNVLNAKVYPSMFIVKNLDREIMKSELTNLSRSLYNELHLLSEDSEQNLLVTIGNKKRVISYDDIIYISTIKHERNSVFMQINNTQIIVSTAWKNIKSVVANRSEFIILKSYIINLKKIYQCNPTEPSLTFTNGETIFIGSKILNKVAIALKEYY